MHISGNFLKKRNSDFEGYSFSYFTTNSEKNLQQSSPTQRLSSSLNGSSAKSIPTVKCAIAKMGWNKQSWGLRGHGCSQAFLIIFTPLKLISQSCIYYQVVGLGWLGFLPFFFFLLLINS